MTTRQSIKRFFEPVRKAPFIRFKAWIQYVSFALGGILFVVRIKYITYSIESNDLISFYRGIGYFVVSTILYYRIRIVTKDRGWAIIRTKLPYTIYREYIEKFISLDNTVTDQIGTGKMISIIQKGFDTRIDLLDLIFWKGTHVFIHICFVVIAIGIHNRYMLIIFIVGFIAIHIIAHKLNLLILQNKRQCNPIQNEYMRSLIKILMSKFEIMMQNKTQAEIHKLDVNREKLYQITKRRTLYIEGVYLIPNILLLVLRICVFFIIGKGIFTHQYNFSDLVFFSSILGLLYVALETSASSIKDFFQKYADVEELRYTFDHTPHMGHQIGSPFTYKSGNIHIHNLNFSYGSNNVFSNFDLQIQGGTKTAFVGESGSGKTTLIKLLAGYIRPDSGEIEIDGQKLSEIKLTDYYKHIGYLTQDPSVFDGTIYENLVYALDIEPLQEDIARVVKLAKCEFIREFEKGLETEIGERGVRLSGGQKQRLAIAKIMLKNPNIILLDEPTSALDSFNEELINIALHNLFKGKTVIVVAHRLQTVKQADRILLFEQGKILEEGTHNELVKLNGKYKKMLDLQSGF